MQIFVDLDTRKLRRSVSNSSPVTQLDFKRGDTELMEIFYVQNNAQVQLAVGALISFGAKVKDAYDGAALVFEDDFTLSGAGATAKYSANPSFSTIPLDAALMVDANPANDKKQLDLMGEITWNDDGVITSSVTFVVRVNNDVLRGDESTPTNLPDPAEWMPAALTFDGADPNDSGDGLTISGIVTPSAANGFYTEGVEVNGYPSYARAGYKIFRTTITYTWMLTTDTVPFATNKFVTAQNVATPDLVTEWTPIIGNEGDMDISLVPGLQGTHLGQLCKASDAWWRWDGTAWVEDVAALELTSGPVRSTAGESSIADNALTIAQTLGLQADLNTRATITGSNITDKSAFRAAIGTGRVFSANHYGASPVASASANVTAIQAALNAADTAGGGIVELEGGVYLTNGTLFIGNYTELRGNGRITLKKTGSFGEVIINKGATTRTVNHGIRLKQIQIDASSIDLLNQHVDGLRGLISMYHVNDLLIEDLDYINQGTGQFALHICNWYRVRINRMTIFDGPKDGVHFGPGNDLVMEDCTFRTLDDGYAFQAADYPGSNPETGNIYDIVLRRCKYLNRTVQAGNFGGGITGAWKAWESGYSYRVGARCVANGKVYTLKSPNGPTVASVQPSHTSGDVLGADGLTWKFDHVGTDTSANIWNVTLENCENYSSNYMWKVPAADATYVWGTTDGEWLNTFHDNIVFDGGTHSPATGGAPTFIGGDGWVKNVTVRNMKFGPNTGALVLCNRWPLSAVDADVRAAQTTRAVFTNSYMQGGFFPSRLNGHLEVTLNDCENTAGLTLATQYGTSSIRGNSKMPASAALPAIEGDRRENLIYSLGRWIDASPLHPLRFNIGPTTPTNLGAGSSSVLYGSQVDLHAGTTANGYAFSKYMVSLNHQGATVVNGPDFDAPFTIAGSWLGYAHQSTEGVIRFVVGGPETPTNAVTDAFTTKGIGVEFGATAAGNGQVRIIRHNGTAYTAAAWVDLGVAVNAASNWRWVLVNMGDTAKTLKLFAACQTYRFSTRLPLTPVQVVTGGPAGRAAGNLNFTGYYVTGNGTIAPASNNIRGLFNPIICDFTVP